jgi:hypothetical protein
MTSTFFYLFFFFFFFPFFFGLEKKRKTIIALKGRAQKHKPKGAIRYIPQGSKFA